MITYFLNRQIDDVKNNILAILAIIFTWFLAGCATPTTRQTADWCYAKDAISINIKSDPLVNVCVMAIRMP